MEVAVIVAVLGIAGGLPAVMLSYRSDRDKLTEQRVESLLEAQDRTIAKLREENEQYRADNAEYRKDKVKSDRRLTRVENEISELKDENQRMHELFGIAVDHVTEWIRFEKEGGGDYPPKVPPRLRRYIPSELL